MEQVLKDRERGPAEEWEEAEEEDGDGKGALAPAREANASAPSVDRQHHIKWARLAMSSDVLNAEPP